MRVLLVYANPVPDSFGATLRDTAVATLTDAGHEIDLLDLYAERFDPVLSREAHALHLAAPSTKPEIEHHVVRLRWAEALVFVYPTWWSGQPAMLKGWMDRVLVEGVAFTLPPGAKSIKPMLRHVRRLAVVTTHGSSKLVNAVQGESGKRVILRGLRSLCHPLARSKWVAMYGVDDSTEEDRLRFVERVERRLRKL